MKCNVGKTDKIIRGVLGVALVLAGLMGAGLLAAIVGVVLLATMTMSFCPLYKIFKISTCKDKK